MTTDDFVEETDILPQLVSLQVSDSSTETTMDLLLWHNHCTSFNYFYVMFFSLQWGRTQY